MKQKQLIKINNWWRKRSHDEIIITIRNLYKMYSSGLLGGEIMPEDANPNLKHDSLDNYLYFTLPMALNYQRNSYKLWQTAKQTYEDPKTTIVFDPKKVVKMSDDDLKNILTLYKVALQPIKQIQTWKKLCHSICDLFNGDIRELFKITNGYVPEILKFLQKTHKSCFPYLSGPKISNYWLYVLERYTDLKLSGRDFLTVAPDTHVIQASINLGLIAPEEIDNPKIQDKVSKAWHDVLKETEFLPIDIHTPLWLWSRNGFKSIIS